MTPVSFLVHKIVHYAEKRWKQNDTGIIQCLNKYNSEPNKYKEQDA